MSVLQRAKSEVGSAAGRIRNSRDPVLMLEVAQYMAHQASLLIEQAMVHLDDSETYSLTPAAMERLQATLNRPRVQRYVENLTKEAGRAALAREDT